MAFSSLRQFINTLEQEGELIRIRHPVNPVLEITEITDRISKTSSRNKALLFENTGSEFPLLINSMGSYRRICLALGVPDLNDIGREIESYLRLTPPSGMLEKLKLLPRLGKFASYLPAIRKGRGICQKIIWKEPNLTKLPVMKCWPEDGGGRGEGRFLTLPVIHTSDPDTSVRNVGLYRMQVFGKDLTALHWQVHKVSAHHYRRYREKGIRRMPVSVILGGDPVYTYAASAPMPEGIDEYILAGFIRRKKVELVKCLTNELYIPADADFVIEGYVDTEEDLIMEGPFGDHTGYYSLADLYPRFHVTAITQRPEPVYPSTIVGIPPQEDTWIGKATERIFLAPIRMTLLPEIRDMNLPAEGVFHNLAVIKIKKEYPGHARKVIHSLWGAGQMMLNKIMIVVDEDCDVFNYNKILRTLYLNTNPETDILFSEGPIDVLDHACSAPAFGGKIGIDATKKMSGERKHPEQNIPGGFSWDRKSVTNTFQEISDINDSFLLSGAGMIIFSITKSRKDQVRDMAKRIAGEGYLHNIRFFIVVDSDVNVQDLKQLVWRFTNNIDAKRDCFVLYPQRIGLHEPLLLIDGTKKTLSLDGFERTWPDILLMNAETIRSVDNMWFNLGLGEYISSPTLYFQKTR